jgi:hypothetical protein
MAKRKPRSEAKNSVTESAAVEAAGATPATFAPPVSAPPPPDTGASSPKGIAFRSEPHADVPVIADASAEETRSSSMGSEPSEEDVRMRAYQRYLDRGANHGEDFDDWLKAEEELGSKKAREGSA